MLRMVIADDEFIVREGLRTIIDWKAFGIEVIAEAVDGQEAYELCEQLHPDILFTDIRMPFMDGLEVAIKLKEQKSDIRVIIISGIQDFNYAKTALNISAEGYILKPIKIDELKEVVKRVASGISKERNREQEMLNLKHQFQVNLPVIREKFLRNLVTGIYNSEQEAHNKLEFLKIPIQRDQSVLVSVIQVDNYNQLSEYKTEEDKQLLSFCVSNIVEEIMSEHNCGISFCLNENEFVLIFDQSTSYGTRYLDVCEELSLYLSRFLKISVSIGIGSIVKNYLHIKMSYNDAYTALNYKFYTGTNSILSITDINNLSGIHSNSIKPETYNLYEVENNLLSCMKLGDREGVTEVIENLFNKFTSCNMPPVDYVQSLCVEIICSTSRALYEVDETLENIVFSQANILEVIYKTENIFDLKKNMFSIFDKIAIYFSNKHNQKNGKVISRIKEIIEKRYNENLSTSKLSEEIYLTPNYLSQIFKQATGETITEYITNTRIERAKELLKTTDFKILEIAEMVGFDNPHYFSTAFRKHTGIHPQKFRSCAN